MYIVVGGSIYPHKKIYKVTCVSLDHTTENKIDNICISKKKGADIALEHLFLTSRLQFKEAQDRGKGKRQK